MKTIAIANAKGGTGKTTLAVHTAVGLANRGRRTLLLDLDYQANATRWLLNAPARPTGHGGASLALEGKGIDARQAQIVDGPLDVIPATETLPETEYNLAQRIGGRVALRNALRGSKRNGRSYDYCVIDCPPNLGIACVCGLCAADAVFVPLPTNFLGLSGLSDLETALQQLRETYRVATTVRGLILFAVDTRKGLVQATRQLLNEHVGGKLMEAEVRISTAAERLPEAHETAWSSGADPRGAEDYPKVLDEMLRRLSGKRKEK